MATLKRSPLFLLLIFTCNQSAYGQAGAPGVPGAPVFSNVTQTTATVTAPDLPANATSLSLQLSDDGFVTTKANLAGGAVTNLTGLTPKTSYTYRYLAVGIGGSTASTEKILTTPAYPLPGVPGAPVFSNITQTTATVTAPVLPANATSLSLQLSDDGFVTTKANLAGGAVTNLTGLLPKSSYTYRYLAVGIGGGTVGPEAILTTLAYPLPGVPDAPIIGNRLPTSVIVTAPALPANATSLRLEKDSSGDGFDVVAQNLAGGATTNMTGLSPTSTYSVRYVAVGQGGATAGLAAGPTAVVPAYPAPAALSAKPLFSNIGARTLTVTAPALTANASSFTLQSGTWDVDFNAYMYNDVQTNLAAGAASNLLNLTPSSAPVYRYVAVGPGGATPGPHDSVTLLADPPTLPVFSNIWSDTVRVTAPALPVGATSMILQGKLAIEAGDSYSDLAKDMAAGAFFDVAGLDSNTAYSFRFASVGPGGLNAGPADEVVTSSPPSVSWSAGDALSCGGIRYPSSGATVAPGARGRLSAFLAADWDKRNVTFNGGTSTQTTLTGTYSDPCSYTWSANGGSVEGGFNTGQSIVWIAPTTPGTYTITLVVDDQNTLNKPNNENGARDDAPRGYNDDPLKFSISVTVQ